VTPYRYLYDKNRELGGLAVGRPLSISKPVHDPDKSC
jgi:hypothetical protein